MPPNFKQAARMRQSIRESGRIDVAYRGRLRGKPLIGLNHRSFMPATMGQRTSPGRMTRWAVRTLIRPLSGRYRIRLLLAASRRTARSSAKAGMAASDGRLTTPSRPTIGVHLARGTPSRALGNDEARPRRAHQRVAVILEKVSEMTTHCPPFLTATHVNLVAPSVEITSAVFP